MVCLCLHFPIISRFIYSLPFFGECERESMAQTKNMIEIQLVWIHIFARFHHVICLRVLLQLDVLAWLQFPGFFPYSFFSLTEAPPNNNKTRNEERKKNRTKHTEKAENRISDDNEHDKVRQINDEKKKLCDEWKTEAICLSNNKRYYISGVKTLKSSL